MQLPCCSLSLPDRGSAPRSGAYSCLGSEDMRQRRPHRILKRQGPHTGLFCLAPREVSMGAGRRAVVITGCLHPGFAGPGSHCENLPRRHLPESVPVGPVARRSGHRCVAGLVGARHGFDPEHSPRSRTRRRTGNCDRLHTGRRTPPGVAGACRDRGNPCRRVGRCEDPEVRTVSVTPLAGRPAGPYGRCRTRGAADDTA
jgi:hypothetical protein